MDFETRLANYRSRVDDVMLQLLPSSCSESSKLKQAMHYSITAGGKRVRPILAYATGEALGADLDIIDIPACAVELMHTYSLIHDDLPAMDNDDLRRGLPTCHKKFDEATAIIAGDALQALAFTLLADGNPSIPASQRLHMIRVLGEASGAAGMAEGQAIDLEAVGKQLDLQSLENMHRHKTGALIRASVVMGALACNNTTPQMLSRLDQYAAAVGLAFQIVDDILDVTSDTETLGKPQGSDIALNKPTYPALLGLDGARKHAQTMHKEALHQLREMPKSFDILRDLSGYIVDRSY